jgi:hypothetical protein
MERIIQIGMALIMISMFIEELKADE